MAAIKQYAYDYIDFSYADAQGKMDARCEDGWVVNSSTLAHPYAFILWERDAPGGDKGHEKSRPGSPSVNPGSLDPARPRA